jgi:hypothetical protein
MQMEVENVNFKDETRASKDKPSWGNCAADEAFA